jgi:hypothetical protein
MCSVVVGDNGGYWRYEMWKGRYCTNKDLGLGFLAKACSTETQIRARRAEDGSGPLADLTGAGSSVFPSSGPGVATLK